MATNPNSWERVQLHYMTHEHKPGETIFVGECPIQKPTPEQFYSWVSEIVKTNPLPEGMHTLFCNEDSRFFHGVEYGD